MDLVDQNFDILPVEDYRNEIVSHITGNQIIICIGETGSGKTTKIPQFCLDENLLGSKIMAITQPRRVAAISGKMKHFQ
jgi:HrpA-like RNA helicase